MKSVNFEFLRPRWKELAALGGFAEQYIFPDPGSAAVKLRSFAEELVDFIWHNARLPRLFRPTFNDKLNDASFRQTVPRVVVSKLHALRLHGNKAAHGDSLSQKTALWLLREAYELGCWLFIAYGGGSKEQCPAYAEPQPAAGEESKAQLKREKKAVLERLAAQEAEMQKLLADLEAERARAEAAEATAAELQEALQAGEAAASVLDFDEETTRRRLIDTALAATGWDVGPNGTSTATVVQEMEVPDQPTTSGIGFADYVLMDDVSGRPLAVIEAKKTARDSQDGRTQAKLYADGLEKKHGHRPVIFYTNGYDIWIWNDAEHEPPRQIFGFYSKDSLEYLHFQRQNKRPAKSLAPDPDIAGRMYQVQAIKQVIERFDTKHRRALIVQATGTGKTRVAVALCKAMLEAGWAKRILFVCDRRELRKQAYNVFKQFMPGEPRTYVTAQTSQDRDKRIYLATYPAMMKCYESFDVGFFDLVIADESHRSIYNRYRDLIKYFDAWLVGLTATPRKDLITHNTYELFGCEDDDPTAYYSYEEAINDAEGPFLVPFRVETFTTPFLRKGIKYWEMTQEQREQLEEAEIEPEAIEYEQHEVDKYVFNKDTNRKILRNLMERGIRDGTGSHVGKTIIFARNHNHAVLLQNLFDEMYPQYGGNFCRVIDNYDPRAEELIDDFKGEGKNPDLMIAVSVDMLDTGIDVPEIVNLVFAKPVYSYIKFWQMIGRGTRLCPDLFGPGEDKSEFLIFDHWGNFEYFEERYTPADTTPPKSLLQRLFETRIHLAETALDKPDPQTFELAIELISKDIADLPERSISVREKWRQVKQAQRKENLRQFDAATKGVLTQDIAPLMQWRNIEGHEEAFKFDLLMCKLQRELLRRSSTFDDLKDHLLDELSRLQMNLNPVRARASTIAEVRSAAFWDNVTVDALERVRCDLRGIMHYRQPPGTTTFGPKVIDVTEDDSLIERKPHKVRLEGLDLAAYRSRVEKVLRDLFDTNPTLQRIKRGEPVTEEDLKALNSLIHTQDPYLDLNELVEYFPDTAGRLDQAIRKIIGRDASDVARVFGDFVQSHNLNSQQIAFLRMLQNHIARHGSIEIDRLYEDPFTTIHNDGLDGVFTDEAQAQELIRIIEDFRKPATEGTEPA